MDANGDNAKSSQIVSNWFVEKSQSCLKQHDDRFACKAFLLTAKTIYPQDFEIQYQAYCFEKSAQDVKQAASILLEMFHKFQQEAKLLDELKGMSKSLQGDLRDGQASFLTAVYEQLPTSVQKEILTLCTEQCQNVLEKCRLRLLLLQRFNRNGHSEAVALVETLLNVEKAEGVKHVVNPYRRLMVHKILPVVLSMDKLSQHCAPKQYSKWLQKAIEYLVTVATQPQPKIAGGEHSSHGMMGGGSVAGDGPELPEGSPWASLQHVLKLVTKNAQWEGGFVASPGSGLNETWSLIRKHVLKHGANAAGDQAEEMPPKPAFYSSLVLLLRAAHHYSTLMSPHQYAGTASHHHQSQVLLEDLEMKKRPKKHKHAHKRRKIDMDKEAHIDSDGSDDLCDVIHPSETTALSAEVTEAFNTALNCWQLLNSNETFQKDFNWLLHRWKAESWAWFNSFQTDRLLYLGESVPAIAMLQARLKADPEDAPLDNQERMRTLVQLASIYHSMTRLSDACDSVLQAISMLGANYVEGSHSRGIVSEGSLTGGGRSGRVLHFISVTPSTLLPYCIQLILLTFKKRVLYRADSTDTGLGHLIVLMQYCWPRDESLFNEAVRRIRKQGHFSYHSFLNYVINIDILEEFAHLKTEDGGKVNLDLLPSSSSVQRQRTVTRGVTRGGKEDFRAAMERQVMRSNDNVEAVIVKFLSEEKESIRLTFADS